MYKNLDLHVAKFFMQIICLLTYNNTKHKSTTLNSDVRCCFLPLTQFRELHSSSQILLSSSGTVPRARDSRNMNLHQLGSCLPRGSVFSLVHRLGEEIPNSAIFISSSRLADNVTSIVLGTPVDDFPSTSSSEALLRRYALRLALSYRMETRKATIANKQPQR